MKKILIVSNYSGSYGSEKMLFHIVNALNHKFEVTAILNGDNKEIEDLDLACQAEPNTFNVISQENRVISLCSLVFWIKKLYRVKPDLVLVNISLIPEVLIATKILRIPVVTFIRESLIDYKKLFHIYKYFLRFFSTKIICNSAYTRSMFKEFANVVTINDTTGKSTFKTSSHKNIEGDIKLVYVGRLSPRKGVDIILDGISNVERITTKKICLDIIGSHKNSEYTYFQKTIEKSLKLRSSVNFLGYLKDPSDIVAKANYCICPSRFPETFGLTVLESLEVGTPVIVNAVGAYPELIQNTVNGFVFCGESEFSKILYDAVELDSSLYNCMVSNCIPSSEKFCFTAYKEKLISEVESVIYCNR